MKILKRYMDKVFLFESVQHHDNRGFFMRSFCHDTLELHGLESKIFQINISHNISEHTFRGYHYQSEPHSETKIISCIKGEIFFSLLNLIKESPFYLNTCNMLLKQEDSKICYVPKGFATAFLTLKSYTEVLYLMSDNYKPEAARGIRFNDPIVQEVFPFKPKVISEKDLNFPNFIT